MKKVLFATIMLLASISTVFAQNGAKISFDQTLFNFGTFPESRVQTHVFTFKNTGTAPLIVNQAVASCGCTVPQYSKKPIMPGEKGSITVTFNSRGQFPSHFKKTVTVRSNGKIEMTRLYIEGTITDK